MGGETGEDAPALLNRIEAAIRLLYPDEMTPMAKRVLDGIVQEERDRIAP